MGASSYNNDRRQEGGYEGSSNSNRNSPPTSSQSDVPPSVPIDAPASQSPASSSTSYASAETADQPYYKSSSFFDETVSLSPTSSYGAGSSDPNEPAAFAGRFTPSALAPAPNGGESYESEASNHQATPVFNGPSQYNSAVEPRNNDGSQSNYGEAPQGYSGNFQQQSTGEGDYGGQAGNSYSSDASSSSGNHQNNEGGDGYGSGPSTSQLAQQAANQVSLSISKLLYENRYAQHQTL